MNKKIVLWIVGIIANVFVFLFLIGMYISLNTGYSVSGQNGAFWVSLFTLVIFNAIIFVGLHIKKKEKKQEIIEVKAKKPIDYKKIALKHIEDAKKLFNEKKYKDAYAMASYGLRFFYSHKLELKTELTAYETLKLIKTKEEHDTAQECLDLCGLVEFAKYQPNEKDFKRIVDSAISLIR